MAELSDEQKKLDEQFRRTNIRFAELSERTKTLADKTLASANQTAKLQAQMSAASEALRGITNVAGPMRMAVQAAAKNLKFLGSALESTTSAVKVASKAHDQTTKNLQRLDRALGDEANTISGINKLETARKAAIQTRTELYDKEIQQIDAAIASQNEVILKRQQEVRQSEANLLMTQVSIGAEQSLIDSKTSLIGMLQQHTIGVQGLKEMEEEFLKTEKTRNEELKGTLVTAKEIRRMELASIAAKQQEIDAIDENIARQRAIELGHQSELSVIEARKAAIAAEIGAAVNVQQRSALESSRAKELQALIDKEVELKNLLTDAQTSLAQEVSTRINLASELADQQDSLARTTAEIQQIQNELTRSASKMQIFQEGIDRADHDLEMLSARMETETKIRDAALSKLNKLKQEEADLIKAVQDNKDALATDTSTLHELTELRQDRMDEETTKKQEDLNDEVDAVRARLTRYGQILQTVATHLNKLVAPILELQKQFGLSAGSAAKLKFENLMASANSYIESLMTGGPSVTSKEIEATQGAFQGEFGGVLTSDAATELAKEAKRMGVGAGEMAKARRAFMTQTMGDTGTAKAAQDKFIGEFAKKGLTAKDAMAAIGQNSELLARNGTRFASSFARAAADAKKIGVDLSKIDQVGDNIIDNFEGFLESQAELGAMGFGFDTSRLAEISETGDTGALMNELRSQLASQGKDLTKLRRSEQLALSKSFGLSMEELQRMAGPTAGSGEETLSPEELQKDANKSLGDLVFRADTIIKILGGIAGLVTLINSKSLINSYVRGGSSIRGMASNALSATRTRIGSGVSSIRGSGLGARIGGMGTLARVGTGVGIGVAGELMSVGGDKLKEAGYTKTGGAVSTLGEVAKYAGIGMMFGPVGAAVGGLVGAVIGITKNFDAWKETGKAAFDLVASGFSMFGKVIMKLVDVFMTLNPVSLISSLFTNGVGGTVDKVKSLFGMGEAKKGDDVVSKSGYGNRTLVTPSGPIALNNNDNVIAYADDMISGAIGQGIRMLSYGALAQNEPTTPAVNIDLSRLEQKLDQVVHAISSMEVKMDGNKVGKILVNNSDAATTVGIFRQNARATL